MCKCCEQQAINMAKYAKITLTKGQIDNYIQEREKMPTGNEQEGCSKPWCLCDQQLLYETTLEEEQRGKFMDAYPNIFRREPVNT